MSSHSSKCETHHLSFSWGYRRESCCDKNWYPIRARWISAKSHGPWSSQTFSEYDTKRAWQGYIAHCIFVDGFACTWENPNSMALDAQGYAAEGGWMQVQKDLVWSLFGSLEKQKVLVFDEMIKCSGYGDKNIAKDISAGFDLMGTLPSSNVFEAKSTFGTLLPEHVRMVSDSTRKAIFNSSRRISNRDVASEICRITEEEVKKGWLKGPLKFGEIPQGASLTRRFGVKQTSSSSSGQQVVKVRPIDDFSESLSNSAVTCNEIVAGIIKRLELLGQTACELKARAIDLRKAYKQLPLSSSALIEWCIDLCFECWWERSGRVLLWGAALWCEDGCARFLQSIQCIVVPWGVAV